MLLVKTSKLKYLNFSEFLARLHSSVTLSRVIFRVWVAKAVPVEGR